MKSCERNLSKHCITSLVLTLLGTLFFPSGAEGAVLTTGSFVVSSGAGQTGAGASTSCMVMSDGSSWSGGAVGVQGDNSTGLLASPPLASNVTFKFSIGSFIDSVNSTYGSGNWAVSNIRLTFQYTLYANNSRFGGGAGDFDIYWVANDAWIQGTNTPAYAQSESELSLWSGGDSLLASEYYDWSTPSYQGTASDKGTSVWVTDKTGSRQSTMSCSLDSTAEFLVDITTAGSGGNSDVSLYLMSMSDTLGLCIFTGGASILPTLTFDVVSIPEPGPFGLLAMGAGVVVLSLLKRKTWVFWK